jgi:PadR family transcriptional regulator, regulatory protein PadR
MTIAVATVLRIFLNDVFEPRYGYELMRLTGFPSGKLYPILARLQRAGWLIREQEQIDPGAAGRPTRRLYRLSSAGIQAARQELGVPPLSRTPPMGGCPYGREGKATTTPVHCGVQT